ncbi:uncharacterized protein RSE6_04808 [Rhynchosporium secalis]|uniref:Uncharacterized protein n=1 Tax=Rhynchosporium secalis TaxID=38038 RepID=A0A1E1M682_RHYSE|nr:uncharacterized protein RSE6_04808 [Rhynchosporium secalis]
MSSNTTIQRVRNDIELSSSDASALRIRTLSISISAIKTVNSHPQASITSPHCHSIFYCQNSYTPNVHFLSATK